MFQYYELLCTSCNFRSWLPWKYSWQNTRKVTFRCIIRQMWHDCRWHYAAFFITVLVQYTVCNSPWSNSSRVSRKLSVGSCAKIVVHVNQFSNLIVSDRCHIFQAVRSHMRALLLGSGFHTKVHIEVLASFCDLLFCEHVTCLDLFDWLVFLCGRVVSTHTCVRRMKTSPLCRAKRQNCDVVWDLGWK